MSIHIDPNTTQTQAAVVQDASVKNDGVVTRAQVAKIAALPPGPLTITSVSPAAVVAGSGVLVTVKGTNFVGGEITYFQVGGVKFPYTVVDDETITFRATIDMLSGPVQITSASSNVTSATNILVTPTDKYGVVVLPDNPSIWWRMNHGVYTDYPITHVFYNFLNPGTFDGSWRFRMITAAPLVASDGTSPQGMDLGNSSGVNVFPPAFDLAGATGVSLEFWIKAIDGYTGDTFWDFGTGLRNNGFGGVRGVAATVDVQLGVPKPFTAILVDSLGAEGTPLPTPSGLNFGTTYHIVFTYDDTVNEGRMYVNGVLAAGPIAMRPPGGFYTGSQSPSICLFTGVWAGVLSEYAWYSYTLPAARVAAHYAAGV